MKKRGRPKKMEPNTTANPFDRLKQEAMYLAYEHGFNSPSKEENPYLDMPEMATAMSAWMQGYNANKKRTKAAKPSPVLMINDQEIPTDDEGRLVLQDVLQIDRPLLSGLTDDVLLTELKNRKQGELNRLLLQKEDLDRRVVKLKALMEL